MRDIATEQRTAALERLTVRARQGFITYGVVLCAVGLIDLARRGFDTGEVHGLRTALVLIVSGVVVHALRRHDRMRRVAIDGGVLLAAAVSMNYARLATKGLGGPAPDLFRLLLLGSLALAGALILSRILPARLDLARHRRRGTIRRGLTGILGAGLVGLGVFLSSDVRGPQQSIAAVIALAPLADHLEGALEEILTDPRGLEEVLASDEIRSLAARFAVDERWTGHPDLRRLARGIAEGDTASLRDLVPPEIAAAARSMLRTAREASGAPGDGPGPGTTSAATPDAVVPVGEDAAAMAEVRRRLEQIAGAMSPEQLARLRSMDPDDPRIRKAFAAHGIDPELAVRLIAAHAPSARSGTTPPAGPGSVASPARSGDSPVAPTTSKVRTKVPPNRIHHLVRLPRATTGGPPSIPTGVRRWSPVRATSKEVPVTEPAPAPSDPASDAPAETEAASPAPPAASAPPVPAAGTIGPTLDEVVSLLRAAAPPPPTPPTAPASRPERYGGAALLVLGLIAVGLSVRRTPIR